MTVHTVKEWDAIISTAKDTKAVARHLLELLMAYRLFTKCMDEDVEQVTNLIYALIAKTKEELMKK